MATARWRGMYVNGTLAGTWTLAQMAASDGYISFEGNGVFANYDNLSISVVSATTYAVTYNGNTSTGGGVPLDANSPYAANATVTVLGNTGGLVKTGYSFINWNTAANGSGTSYSQETPSPSMHPSRSTRDGTGPDFIWDNGAGTALWTTTDANWLGAAWVNSLPTTLGSDGRRRHHACIRTHRRQRQRRQRIGEFSRRLRSPAEAWAPPTLIVQGSARTTAVMPPIQHLPSTPPSPSAAMPPSVAPT